MRVTSPLVVKVQVTAHVEDYEEGTSWDGQRDHANGSRGRTQRTMALDQSALLEVLEALKAADVDDRIRAAAITIYQALIEAELTAVIGAAPLATLFDLLRGSPAGPATRGGVVARPAGLRGGRQHAVLPGHPGEPGRLPQGR